MLVVGECGRHAGSLGKPPPRAKPRRAAMARRMIYFEDLEVGAETDFGSYDVTREEVLEFARKYDPAALPSVRRGGGARPISAGSRRAAGTPAP